MTQDIINEHAQKKFIELRSKLKLDIQKPILQETMQLTQQKIDQMSDLSRAKSQFQAGIDEATEKARNIDNVFNFIDSLLLPPNLSLAIGLIISGHKTGNKQNFSDAITAIGESE